MNAAQLVAHRGHPARFPENTLAGIESALRAGARFLEIDVQLTADLVPVLFHDRTLERLCGIGAAVHDLDLEAFGALEIDGERAATLGEFVAVLAMSDARAFVEVKRVSVEHLGCATVVERVLRELETVRDRAAVISFAPEVLADARERGWPQVGLVLEEWEQKDEDAAFVFADVELLPDEGPIARPPARLAVYDVVDPDEARALLDRGADLVETFAIERMLEAAR